MPQVISTWIKRTIHLEHAVVTPVAGPYTHLIAQNRLDVIVSLLMLTLSYRVTPNAAFGGFTAMESAVVLANEIHRAVSAHPSKKAQQC